CFDGLAHLTRSVPSGSSLLEPELFAQLGSLMSAVAKAPRGKAVLTILETKKCDTVANHDQTDRVYTSKTGIRVPAEHPVLRYSSMLSTDRITRFELPETGDLAS